MADFAKQFGENLVGKSGDVSAASLADKDVIGIYFSAHWCPPCRAFTPKLAEYYKKLTGAGKKWEVVFVSFDRSQEDCNGYFDEMPWTMVKFTEDDIKSALSDKYGVSGIPALILIDAKTGELITKDGREIVSSDPEGAKFPWK